jgi:hypothetical protein
MGLENFLGFCNHGTLVLEVNGFEQEEPVGYFFRVRTRNLPEPLNGKTLRIYEHNGMSFPKAGNRCNHA